MKHPKISVIVPVYKVERYLRKCVDSILAQTLRDIEIILVDDGSPDGCGEIIDEYAAIDARVISLHQENRGYSAAVNRGIEMARGEYIGIIESDDWIEPDMYESLYNKAARDVDIIKGGFFLSKLGEDEYYVSPSDVDLKLAPKKAFSVEEWPEIIAFHASIWSAIYRADFLKKHKLPESCGASYQDLPFMVELMTSAEKIAVVPKGFVHWRNDPEQEHSTSEKGEKLIHMVNNTALALDILRESGKYEALKEAFFAQAIWTNSSFLFKIKREYREQYYRKLARVFSALRDDAGFSGKFLRPEDRKMIDVLVRNRGVEAFRLAYIAGGVRRKFARLLK